MADKTIIIDIEVSNAEAVREIDQSTAALGRLKKQEEELREERKLGQVSTEQYYKELVKIREETERHKQNVQSYQKVLKANIKTEQEESDSLNNLRKQLSALLKQYDALSQADREGEKGKGMLTQIQNLTGELNQAEQASGRFGRNVGNYQSALDGLPERFGSLAGSLGRMTSANGNFLQSLGMSVSNILRFILNIRKASAAAGGFGKALKLLAMSNPLGIILTAITAIIGAISKLINRSKEAAEEQRKFAEETANSVTKYYDETMNEMTNLSERSAEAYVEDADIVFKRMNEMEERMMLFMAGFNTEERKNLMDMREGIEALGDQIRTETENDENWKWTEKGQEVYRQYYAVLTQYTGTFYQQMRQWAYSEVEAQRQMFQNAAQQYGQALRAQESFGAQSQKQQTRRFSGGISSRKSKQEQAAREELALVRKVEDLKLEAMQEGLEKELALLSLTYTREKTDLEKKLKEDKTLTKKAREAINEELVLLEARHELKMSEMRAEFAQKELDKEAERYEELIEKDREAAELMMSIELQQYENMLQAKLNAAKDNAEKIAKANEEGAQRELEIARNRLAELKKLNAEEIAERYKSMQEYQLAIEQSNNAILTAEGKVQSAALATKQSLEAVSKSVREAQENIASQFAGIAGSMAQMFQSMAQNNKNYAGAAKAFGLMQILISSGVSMAKAVEGAVTAANATGPAAPFTLAGYIAEMVGLIVSTIAQAREIFSQAEQTFATGGVVRGAGTGTSDSITARVSNGESVLTAKATSMFYDQLSAMNVAGGGKPFDRRGGTRFATGGVVSTSAVTSARASEQQARMIAAAVENMHPVVSVKEINNMQRYVAVKEHLAKQ